jgi:hypothetical protein
MNGTVIGSGDAGVGALPIFAKSAIKLMNLLYGFNSFVFGNSLLVLERLLSQQDFL